MPKSEEIKKASFFSEFPGISSDKWVEKINEDLRKSGKTIEELNWIYNEKTTFAPFYTHEERNEYLLYEAQQDTTHLRSYHKQAKPCNIGAHVYLNDLKRGRERIEFLLQQDVNVLVLGMQILDGKLHGIPILTTKDLEYLLEGVDLEKITLVFDCGLLTEHLLSLCLNFIEINKQINKKKISIHFNYNPTEIFLQKGTSHLNTDFSKDIYKILDKLFLIAKDFNGNIKPICISDSLLQNSGASVSQCLGTMLAMLDDCFRRFIVAMGPPSQEQKSSWQDHVHLFSRCVFLQVTLGSHYFIEIAHIRALRFLISSLFCLYEEEQCFTQYNYAEKLEKLPQFYISGESTLINKSYCDSHNNILRATNEMMAGLLAEVDQWNCVGHDKLLYFSDASPQAQKIGIQSLHILQKEAFFNRVIDPLGGSYYLEALTKKVAEDAWEFFLKIQEQAQEKMLNKKDLRSPLQDAIHSSFLQKEINEHYQKNQKEFNEAQTHILLGVNQFPNAEIKIPEEIVEQYASITQKKGSPSSISEEQVNKMIPIHKNMQKNPRKSDSILEYKRFAENIEMLRIATQIYAQKNPCPKVFLLRWGELKISKQYANFVNNVIASIGYEIQEGSIHKNMDDAINEGFIAAPDILVFCMTSEHLPEFFAKLSDLLVDNDTENRKIPFIAIVGAEEKIKLEPSLKASVKENPIHFFLHRKMNLYEELSHIQKTLGIIKGI